KTASRRREPSASRARTESSSGHAHGPRREPGSITGGLSRGRTLPEGRRQSGRQDVPPLRIQENPLGQVPMLARPEVVEDDPLVIDVPAEPVPDVEAQLGEMI